MNTAGRGLPDGRIFDRNGGHIVCRNGGLAGHAGCIARGAGRLPKVGPLRPLPNPRRLHLPAGERQEPSQASKQR